MQSIPHFLFSPLDLKTFLGLYLGVNPFRAPPGAMELAENLILKSQGVIEPRRGMRPSAVCQSAIDAFAYKQDQKKLLSVAYDNPARTYLPQMLGHRTPFSVYDPMADTWAQAFMLPGNQPFDRPRAGVMTRFATAQNALFLQSRYGLLKMENANTPMQTLNLIQESVRLNHSPWTVGGATVSEFWAVGPDGNPAASKLQATATNGFHYLQHAIAFAPGGSNCFSVFAQAGTASWLRLIDNSAVGNGADFDLTNGVVGRTVGAATAAIYPVPGQPGWYRCTLNLTANAATLVALHIGTTSSNIGGSWNAAGTENLYLYGAQVEALSIYSPAPLVQTLAGTAQRNSPTLRPAVLVKPWSQPVGSAWAGNQAALTSAGSWLAVGNQVAYRLTIARKGANNELIESEPSERIIVANTSSSPQGVSWTFDAHFMYPRDAYLRLWRSQQIPISGVGSGDPSDECFLIAEIPMPTLAALGPDGYLDTTRAQQASITDLTPDTSLFVPLYTNPSTGIGRGLLDSNNTAPAARDIAYFKSRMYYCGPRDIHRLVLKVIGTGNSGVALGSTITIDGVTFTFSATDTGAYGPQLFTAGLVSQNLENTARALVAHINNHFAGRGTIPFTAGLRSVVYASYLGTSSSGAGQILLQRLMPGCEPIRVTTSSRQGWDRDYTSLTLSDDNFQIAGIGWSPIGQPEAVPSANYAIVGDTALDALRVIPLREALFLFKKDGLYKITDDGSGPVITLLDPTVKLIAPETAVAVDNTIIALAESGVVLVSEGTGAVNISDDQIGRPLRKLVLYAGTDIISKLAYGTAYQGQRQYILALPESPTATGCTLYYIYNLQTQTWTTMTLPMPTTAGIAQFDANVLYFGAGSQPMGDAFRGFMIERNSGGNGDYQDLAGTLRSPTTAQTNQLVFRGDLTQPVYGTPNIFLDSQDRFSFSNWTRTNAVATDGVTARGTGFDGGATLSVLADNTTNGAHTLGQGVLVEPGQNYTFWAILKAGTLGFAALDTGAGLYAVFNLTAGTVAVANGVTAVMQAVPGQAGWYRCAITFAFGSVLNASAITLDIQVGGTQAQATPGNSYAGTGQDILIGGVQVERSPAMTTYIPTPLPPSPLVPGDMLQQFQSVKAITQYVKTVSYSSATGQTTVTLDGTPAVAWTATDPILVSKAIKSRLRMLPQSADHPLTAKVWREGFLAFRYFDLDSVDVDWQTETLQFQSNNPATEAVASSLLDAAPILVLPFANSAGPFGQYAFGRQTRDIVVKATIPPDALASAQIMLGLNLGQAQRRFELSAFDIVMSGKTERTVR